MQVLELNDVHTYYGESHILQGVSLNIAKGSLVAVLGRNGVGKTTLIRSIMGLTAPRQGAVRFKGRNIVGLPPFKVARLGIGLIPQGRHIFASLTVKENLILAARSTGRNTNWQSSIDNIWSNFPLLKDLANRKGNQLSGGEQQILCIARALVSNPELLLMDEPSEGLAPLLIVNIGEIIQKLKGGGFSILLVEQHIPLALQMADYIYVMAKGAIKYESTSQELAHNDQVKAQYLGV